MNDTVTIEHDTHGRVEGVKRELGGTKVWVKDGAIYCASRGWREFPETKWVPVETWEFLGCLSVANCSFHLPKGYRWKKVEIEREEKG